MAMTTSTMRIDWKKPIPIYSEIDFDNNNLPFKLSQAKRENCFDDLKCEKVEFIPHVHTTHLETKDHLSPENVKECLSLSLSEPLLTQVIDPETEFDIEENVQFVILNKSNPEMIGFGGINPEVIERISSNTSVLVIGINEPSFDPENDGGKLLAHKAAFSKNIYLIEMLNFSDDKKVEINNLYYCVLNIFRFSRTDAYPCSPILYPLK